jgi:hypothetical protein
MRNHEENGTSFMTVLFSPGSPDILLVLGVIFFFKGLISICTGVALTRVGRTIRRAKEPKAFWRLFAWDCLIGVCSVGYFLYKLYALSN